MSKWLPWLGAAGTRGCWLQHGLHSEQHYLCSEVSLPGLVFMLGFWDILLWQSRVVWWGQLLLCWHNWIFRDHTRHNWGTFPSSLLPPPKPCGPPRRPGQVILFPGKSPKADSEPWLRAPPASDWLRQTPEHCPFPPRSAPPSRSSCLPPPLSLQAPGLS